jgi:hypothetical protein
MEEDDLEQIRVIMTARFTKEDRERYPVEYVQRDTEEESDLEEEESDSEEGSDEEDLARLAGIQAREVFTERKKSASRVGNLSRGMSKNKRDSESTVRMSSSEKIKKRRELFEREIFEEKNLLEALRYIFGPKNLVQGVEALRAIRMESNSLPYRSLQESAEYVAHFQETLEWVGDFKPSSKMVKQLFIKGVQPKELQEELSLREIKSLEVLQDTFAEIFYENYSSIQRLGAAGAMRGDEKKTDTGTRVRDTQGKTGFTRDGGSFRKGMIWTPKRDEDQRTPAGGPAPVTPKKTGDKLCFLCNQAGHFANACPSKSSRSAGTIVCYVCNQPGHMANACPTRAGSVRTPGMKTSRSLLRSTTTEKRAVLACCAGVTDGPEPTLQMLVNVDSLSDVNLLPSQWLVVLQGEGVVPQPLDVPFSLQWGIGVAEVKITHSVELSVRVMAWAGQKEPIQYFYSI